MSEPLEEIQDHVLDRLHAGEAPDREALLAAHPEHAEALGRFLDLLTEIESPPPPASAKEPVRLGEFRILRERGRGGMGIVYEAEQASLKRRVALKVLPPALAQDPRVVARFRREAEAAGRLRHPNIVPVYSVGETGGTSFFAMELVEGRSLSEAIAERVAGKDAGLPPAGDAWRRWAVETGARIADALHYAHGQGILHRDIKPGNVLLEADGTPRLTDFGLALDLAAPGLTATGETFGTPLYMSPEQALRREAPLDPRTDVYSLGVTLYESLTLRPPYEGSSTAEILTALHLGRVVRPGDADPGMPEALERILLRALRHDAAERYPTMAAFAEDLRNWLASRPVDAPPPPSSAPAPRTRKAVVTLSVSSWIAAAVLVAVGGFLLFRGRGPTPIPPAGLVLSGEDLRRLGAGEFPDGEKRLAAWLRPSVHLRGVVARSHLGGYECSIEPGSTVDFDDERCAVTVLARFEASADGGPWKDLGIAHLTLGAKETGSQNLMPSLKDSLGDSLAKGSVTLRHRATCRILPRPPGWEHGHPVRSGEGGEPKEEAWALPAGAVWTWSEERTLFVYDEYPAGYPEAVAGPAVDASMVASLRPARFLPPDLSVWDGRRKVGFSMDGFAGPGPLPVACEVELLDPASGRAVGTMSFSREAAPAVPEPGLRTNLGYGFSFTLPESPASGEERFVLDLVEGRADAVRLRFRPSREFALADTTFERMWGGTLEMTVPSMAAEAKGKGTEVRVVPATPATPPPALAKGAKTWEAFRRLCEGKPLPGDPPLEDWVRPSVQMRSFEAPELHQSMEGESTFTCLAALAIPETPTGTGPKEDVLLLARWERAYGDGLWEEIGFTESTLSMGTGPAIEGTHEFPVSTVDPPFDVLVHLRASFRLLPLPEGWGEDQVDLVAAWKAPALATGSWRGERTVRIVDHLPADYPKVVGVAGTPEDEEMRRSLVPDIVKVSLFYKDILVVRLPLPESGPWPAAVEAEAFLGEDKTPLGKGWLARDAAGGRGQVTHVLRIESDSRAGTAVGCWQRGEVKGIRIVLRPSRTVALEQTRFDSYWGGTVEFTAPVRVE